MSGYTEDRSGHVSGSVKGDGVRRADAQRNRERILRAARELVREPGELRLNAVARACGIGQGTLYRHFPTREDLLAEVYRREVDELVAAAPHLLATHQPVDALAAWFDRVAAYARVKRDVFAAVEAATGHDLAAHSLGPIGEAVELLLAAGRSAAASAPTRKRAMSSCSSAGCRGWTTPNSTRGDPGCCRSSSTVFARGVPGSGDQAGSPEGR